VEKPNGFWTGFSVNFNNPIPSQFLTLIFHLCKCGLLPNLILCWLPLFMDLKEARHLMEDDKGPLVIICFV
jgi:hypothetical protein